jgi:hypothetical protein
VFQSSDLPRSSLSLSHLTLISLSHSLSHSLSLSLFPQVYSPLCFSSFALIPVLVCSYALPLLSLHLAPLSPTSSFSHLSSHLSKPLLSTRFHRLTHCTIRQLSLVSLHFHHPDCTNIIRNHTQSQVKIALIFTLSPELADTYLITFLSTPHVRPL